MKASFAGFEEKFSGKVFVIFSLDGEIANKEIIREIRKEIERISNQIGFNDSYESYIKR
jgi:hypothetical protein